MIDVLKKLEEIDPVKENQQVDEFLPVLAAGARGLMALGPLLARTFSAGKAAAPAVGNAIAKGAGSIAKTGAEVLGKSGIPGAVAQNAPKVATGAAIWDAYDTVKKQVFGGNDQAAGQIFNDKNELVNAVKKLIPNVDASGLLGSLVDMAIKYALPIGVVIALIYGGTKLIKSLSEEAKMMEQEETQMNDLTVESLRYLAGVNKTLKECGIMPMEMGGMSGMEHRPPATFSINASAADGSEVSSMLRDIMNLAGVSHSGSQHIATEPMGAEPIGNAPSEPLSAIAAHSGGDGGSELMRATMDKLNDVDKPEDEGLIGGALGGYAGHGLGGAAGDALGAMAGLPPGVGGAIGSAVGTGAGAIAGDRMTGENEPEADSGGDIASMADEVRDMADELSSTSKDELGLESYDNTPNDPNDIPAYDSNKMAYRPNAGNPGNRMDGNMPRGNATFEDHLYAEYKKFVNEGEKKTMSRAAKGYEKYGKKGMQALAKAGREGKDLEPIQDKFNKYN